MILISKLRLIATLLALIASTDSAAENIGKYGNGSSITTPDVKEVYDNARGWLEGFLQGTGKAGAMVIGAKVPLANTSGIVQYISLSNVSWENGKYVGTHLDQKSWPYKTTKISFKHEDAVDWLFFQRSSRRIGINFSACAVIKMEYPRAAAKMLAKYKLHCDN